MKVHAARPPRRLNGFEGRQKGVLGEILALVPIAGKPVDHLEHQSAILVNERLDRLGRRLGIDPHGVTLPLLNVLHADVLPIQMLECWKDHKFAFIDA